MLDASGYGCLAAHRKGERHSASSYKFVNVYCPARCILLYLVSDDSGGLASCTAVCVCSCADVCVSSHVTQYEKEGKLTQKNETFMLTLCASFDKTGRKWE